VQREVQKLNATATAANLMYRSAFCAVVYGPGYEPHPALKKLVETIFTRHGGQFIVLSASTIEDLMQRRARRMAQLPPGQTGLTYESSNKVAVPVVSEESLTREENEPHMRSTVEFMVGQGLPFVEIYKVFLHVNFQLRLNVIKNDMTEPYITGLSQQVEDTQKYLLTQSARAMHKAVCEPYTSYNDEWTFSTDFDEWVGGKWIEQDIPQPFPELDMHLKAVWIQPRHDPDYKLLQQVIIIDKLTRHQFAFIYHIDENRYEPTIDYECRHGMCQNVKVPLQGEYLSYFREPCLRCKEEMQIWIHWLHTTGRMLRRDFATSPDPQEWEEREMKWYQRKLMPRHHGKGKPKEKMVESRTYYSVIKYEVSEKHFPRFQEENVESLEKVQNWHLMHSKDDIIYERRTVPPSVRAYRKEYWQNLKEEVVQAGGNLVKKVEIDGEDQPREIIYTLESQGGENYYVVGSVAGYEKYFPMLRPEARKQQVIKKVTAKKFDGDSEG
jgi:predicted esterase YcpF (UPF0227 family)